MKKKETNKEILINRFTCVSNFPKLSMTPLCILREG